MNIKITGKNLNLSKSFRLFLKTKLEVLSRYLNKIQYMDITIVKLQNLNHSIQLKIGVPGTRDLIIEEKRSGLREAVDSLRKRAEVVLTAHKEKSTWRADIKMKR